ncbi:pickpocket 13 isoform X2 [Andrena cerasifolii]|uniref:pickpocket 13 isoform X2 n=1 Tax=Andrena cerasifolii TaxID=2819439 RepID=UPI004037D464
MWKQPIRWWKIIKQYLSNCNIHGVRYLVDDRLSYPERFFWLLSCALCWYGCAKMIRDVLRNYINYPVAVTTETLFVDWETPFPAIAFCISTTRAIKTKYFKRNPGMFTNYTNPLLLQATAEELLSAYEEIRVPCTEMLADCAWNNARFNCCSEFQELRRTGIGYCIATNTFHLSKNRKSGVELFVNRTVKYGDLIVDVHVNSKTKKHFLTAFSVHVLNNLQLPMLTNVEMDEIHIKGGKTTHIGFTMDDTFNEDGVKTVAVRHRSCRFPHETLPNNMFNIYSSDSCYIELIIERMIKFCGCVNFYYFVPNEARVCNGTEMVCIIANKANITSQSVKDERCLPDCEGTAIVLNRMEPYEYDSPGSSYSRLQFALLSHPTMRYRRYVVNDLLDVVVSVGSALGLFMGVSILSIFEIPYWLFIRRDKIT